MARRSSGLGERTPTQGGAGEIALQEPGGRPPPPQAGPRRGAGASSRPRVGPCSRPLAAAYSKLRIIPARRGAATASAAARRAGGWLALEVDDHEVPPGVQHLAQVVVAVAPDAHGRRSSVGHGAEPARAASPPGRAAAGLVLRRLGHGRRARRRSRSNEVAGWRGGLVERALVEGRERLGREGRCSGRRGQGEVQLRGALAEEPGMSRYGPIISRSRPAAPAPPGRSSPTARVRLLGGAEATRARSKYWPSVRA